MPTAAAVFSASRSGGDRLQKHQVINHFPTHYELTRKGAARARATARLRQATGVRADLLAKNWKRYVRECNKYGRPVPDILPTTFYIPSDYGM